MISQRLTKAVLALLLLGSFVGLFPLSVRIADPLATQRFDPSVDARILLLWPDRLELWPASAVAKVSPRPQDGLQLPNSEVPPRIGKEWLAKLSTSANSHWIVHVGQLGPEKQRIQLELLGDGYYGIVYEATSD